VDSFLQVAKSCEKIARRSLQPNYAVVCRSYLSWRVEYEGRKAHSRSDSWSLGSGSKRPLLPIKTVFIHERNVFNAMLTRSWKMKSGKQPYVFSSNGFFFVNFICALVRDSSRIRPLWVSTVTSTKISLIRPCEDVIKKWKFPVVFDFKKNKRKAPIQSRRDDLSCGQSHRNKNSPENIYVYLFNNLDLNRCNHSLLRNTNIYDGSIPFSLAD